MKDKIDDYTDEELLNLDPFEIAGLVISDQFGEDVLTDDVLDKLPKELRKKLMEGEVSTTDPELIQALTSEKVQQIIHSVRPVKPIKNEESKIGRNAPCPCCSGKKYKKCCMKKKK